MDKRKEEKKEAASQSLPECGKAETTRHNKLEQLGKIPIVSSEKINAKKVNTGKIAVETQTLAQQEHMNVKLIGIAGNVTELLKRMGIQLEKEDEQRQRLVNFFKWFTVAITSLPVLVIVVIYLVSKGEVGIFTQLAALAAFINVPVSSIGVLKCIAKSLFNDTYRKTMPEMITNIIEALAKYDVVYSKKAKKKK